MIKIEKYLLKLPQFIWTDKFNKNTVKILFEICDHILTNLLRNITPLQCLAL